MKRLDRDVPLQTLVRDFLDATGLPIAELGRRAAKSGRAMSSNTIRTVLDGGAYNEDTERRLRRAIEDFKTAIDAYWGEHGEDTAEAEEAAERVTRRRDQRRGR